MIVNFAFHSMVWATSVLIVAAHQDTFFESGDATPSPSPSAKAAQTHSVIVGNVSSLELNVFDEVKC